MNLDVLYQSVQKSSDSGHLQPILLYGHSPALLDALVTRFAQMIVCEGNTKPCGTCSQCTQYEQGVHPYVVDLSKENSPDELYGLELARQFIRRINFRATKATPVVAIARRLDEFTCQSLNALLKVFEEAPDYIFILLTAKRIRELPATLLSRVRRVRLRDNIPTDTAVSLSISVSHDPVALFKDKAKKLLSHRSVNVNSHLEQQSTLTEVFTDVESSVRAFLQTAAYTPLAEKAFTITSAVRLMHSIARAKKRLAQNANPLLTLQSIMFHLL